MPGPTPPLPDTPRLTLDEIRRRDLELDALSSAAQPASNLKPGVTAGNGVAVVGQDGHMFIGDGANRWERQFRGELAIPEAWLSDWSRVLEQRQAQAAALGVALRNVVLPEKQAVYPEKRWPGGDVTGEARPLMHLLARLGPEPPLLYGAPPLLARKADAAVWFRRNSHWNATGCCLVATALAASLDAQVPLESVRFAYRERSLQHDLPMHFFEAAPFEDAGLLDAPVHTFFNNRLYEDTGRHTGSSFGLRNPAAPDSQRVVVFGDSYSYDVGFTFALAEIFAEVVFVWSKSIDWALVEQHQSQVVIWESAERFLATLPQA
jgi:alginate O-acetyltransferase complex protein AlgJ